MATSWGNLLDMEIEEAIPQRLGATPINATDTAFRVWAPKHSKVGVEIGDTRYPLERSDYGYHVGVVANAPPGTKYKYWLGNHGSYPDPASAFQPDGVHGASEVIDPQAFVWTDTNWRGVAKRDLVIYELHIGTLTQQGTYRAAIDELPRLVELGITAIELLPVAQTPGGWNWGYDGVGLYAPEHFYGRPDDLKALVDACHAVGLAVLLDVVYNHLGPEGNYLSQFGPYTSPKHHTPWGDALNYDDRHCEGARRFVIENAVRWLDEFHFDGLRLDAVHFIYDDSQPTVLEAMRAAVDRFATTTDRAIHLIGETNAHTPELLCASKGQSTAVFDAVWSDCLMHAIYSHCAPEVRLVDRKYHGTNDIAQALQHGFVYHGGDFVRATEQQLDEWSHNAAGDPFIESFVTALQTHDSVGNHPRGVRFHQLTSKAMQKAAAALTLLHPSIPLLFMGEEFASDAPFPFFADFHDRRLRRAVNRGRAREYPSGDLRPLHPTTESTFKLAKLPNEQDAEMRDWYGALLKLRREGLAEGWLDARRMAAGYDQRIDTLWMQFSSPHSQESADAGSVTVYSRLRPEGDPVPIAAAGEVLLASAPLESCHQGVQLGVSQAVVVRCKQS